MATSNVRKHFFIHRQSASQSSVEEFINKRCEFRWFNKSGLFSIEMSRMFFSRSASGWRRWTGYIFLFWWSGEHIFIHVIINQMAVQVIISHYYRWNSIHRRRSNESTTSTFSSHSSDLSFATKTANTVPPFNSFE